MGIRASYDDKRQGFAGKTVQPIKAGEELLFYYGNFCIDDAINMCGVAPPLYFPFSPPRIPSLPITSHYFPFITLLPLTHPYRYGFAPKGAPACKASGTAKKQTRRFAKGKPWAKGKGPPKGPLSH